MRRIITLLCLLAAFYGGISTCQADVTIRMRLNQDTNSIRITENTTYDDLLHFADDDFYATNVRWFILSGPDFSRPQKVTKENWTKDTRKKLLQTQNAGKSVLSIITAK